MASIQRSCLVDEIPFTCFLGFTALVLLVLVESCDLARVILGITVGPKVGVGLTTCSQLTRFVAGHASAKTLASKVRPRTPFDNHPAPPRLSCHNFSSASSLCRACSLFSPSVRCQVETYDCRDFSVRMHLVALLLQDGLSSFDPSSVRSTSSTLHHSPTFSPANLF